MGGLAEFYAAMRLFPAINLETVAKGVGTQVEHCIAALPTKDCFNVLLSDV